MAVDPSQGGGLPPGVPPAPAAPMAPGAPAAPNPTTDADQLAAILAAIMAEGTMQFEAEQQAALGQAVTQLLQQTPNAAGQEASSLPGQPMPPPMPGQDAGMEDPSLAGGAAGY